MDNLNKKNITIPIHDERLQLSLRTANEVDLPNLRQWKNEQREFFFFKGEISPEQQREWFRAYQARGDDYMFIVRVDETAIGCMGIRLLADSWDVYNVILGLAEHGGKGLMSKAFQTMLRFATSRCPKPITVRVLKRNPAVGWYKNNGFVITPEKPDHFYLSYKPENITKETI
jgi:RimJ/RimL family protein N-acetyltransferase